ncbi:MAG TPA: hypothetical protein VGG14_08950 [Candidatus Sulfotelmatobacter sp.]|jgi:hypothetical protein
MKLTAFVRMFALFVFVAGSTFIVYAQDQHEDAKPAQDEARPEAAKPPQDAAHPQEEKPVKPGEMKGQEQAKPDHDNARPVQEPKGGRENENMGKPEQAGHPQSANAQHGRIPDDQFRAHFGREHTVVIHQPVVVGGQPRFQFGGYWFAISQPWPGGWAYTDDCYIDYVDGEYFLFDLLHPGVRVALIVVE